MTTSQQQLATYFSGERLFGDDFTLDEIEQWFADEAEACAEIATRDASYSYEYDAMNQQLAYSHLRGRRFSHVLGLGAADGAELIPLAPQMAKLTILEPSKAYKPAPGLAGVECEYVAPVPSGDMPFKTGTFDLVSAIGVLHHIPNVSHVVAECHRCLAVGGVMFLREPIVTMGDWTKPRQGLSRHERGIPLAIMDGIVKRLGFRVVRRQLWDFPLVTKLAAKVGVESFNSPIASRLDLLLSRLTGSAPTYHRLTLRQKLAPASISYLLEKRG